MNSEQMLARISEQGIRIGELGSALFDVLDGSYQWYEIQGATGLDEERCKEIQALFEEVKES